VKLPFVVVSLLFCACGTEHTRLSFPVEISGDATDLLTDSGWSVSATKATAHLSTLRFFEGKVLVAQRSPWWRSLLVSEAWAHPGHYIPGEAMAELLTPLELDLLATSPTAWGTADGITGDYGSAELGFEPLGIELEGSATKGAQTIDFATHFAPRHALEGLRFDREMTSAPGTVSLSISLKVIVSRMDFAQLGASAKPLDDTSPAFNGFSRGVDDTSGYLITWKEN
jgi:hypothetical protein